METGYKAFRIEVLRSLDLREDGFGIEPEITGKVCKRQAAASTSCRSRTTAARYDEGKKITWRDGFRAIWVLVRVRVRRMIVEPDDRRRRAGLRRGGADRRDARRHPRLRRPRSSSSTTPRATRRPSAPAAVADPRVERARPRAQRAASAPRSSPATSARSPSGSTSTAVMAGDNQMDPDELEAIVGPVARGEVDYAKANRLFTGQAWELIPHNRYLGNAVLSLLTKIASGYWHVADSQAGYTAISLRHARAARPRPRLHALRLPERHARPPERRQRPRPRRPVAPDLRRRRALRDPPPQGRAAHLVAARSRASSGGCARST